MVAAVFSRCKFIKHLSSHIRQEKGCCDDPAVYERINEETRDSIWEKAPGVRDTSGCRKNEIKSKENQQYNLKLFINSHFYRVRKSPSDRSVEEKEKLQMWCRMECG